ncbi:hypothetical protein BDR22DRAFT_890063 [Usnea florida]
MFRFHRPRISCAIVFALICSKTTFASPLTFPVHSLRADHLSIIDATEPVNIIPTEDLPEPEALPDDGIANVSNDGTTVTTTYNTPRDVAPNTTEQDSVSGASEPVNVLPESPKFNVTSSDTVKTTNDGTTLTTDYSTSNRNLLQTKSNATDGLHLISTNNRTLLAQDVNMGLNCEGSRAMCIGADQGQVMHTLRDYMYAIPDGYRYYNGQDIACMVHHVYPYGWITWGFYCAFMQGNIPAEGFDGATVQLKMQQMIEHHCLGCGSVPFSPDNDPNTLGILTVNYVSKSECEGLCYYVPPGYAPNPAVTVPKGMTLASQ